MRVNLKYKSLVLSLSVLLTSCSASLNLLDSSKSIISDSSVNDKSKKVVSSILSKEEISERDKEYNFSTKALTESYFKRKLQKLVASDNGSTNGLKIVKELEYARIKGETKIPAQAMFSSDNTFFNVLKSVSAVVNERTSNSPFHVFLGGSLIPSNVILVKSNATGSNNGTSWANAYTSLATALTEATSGQEIWVASGTYKPTTGTDRNATFTLKNGVEIYGGFEGTEALRTSRNWNTNVTILSGDLNNSNSSNSGDSYNVVTGATEGTLDGFTIKFGYADGGDERGAGINNFGASATYNNLVIRDNIAVHGAGMRCTNSTGVTITNTLFYNNSANLSSGTSVGGGMLIENSGVVMQNNVFESNSSNNMGGGLYMYSPSNSVSIENTIFVNNNANNYGGGIYFDTSTATPIPSLRNVTIYNNSSSNGAGIGNNGPSTGYPLITNSIIWGNLGDSILNSAGSPNVTYSNIQGGYTGTGNINSDPIFVNAGDPDGADNIWMTADDGLVLQSESSSKNTGTNTGVPSTDITGLARPKGILTDMGAYEYNDEQASFISCKYLKDRGINTSGLYSIDTDGAGLNAPFNAYCDMTSDGGGWLQVAAQYEADPVTNWDEGIQSDYDPSLVTQKGFALNSSQLPTDRTQVSFGKDLNPTFVDYFTFQYNTGNISKQVITGLKNSQNYHIFRDTNSFYGYHDPEDSMGSDTIWNNTFSIDKFGVIHSDSWAFSPNHTTSSIRGYSINGIHTEFTNENYAWTVWVR